MKETYEEGQVQLDYILTRQEPGAVYDRRFQDPNGARPRPSPPRSTGHVALADLATQARLAAPRGRTTRSYRSGGLRERAIAKPYQVVENHQNE